MESPLDRQSDRREYPRINLETKVSFRTSEMSPMIPGWIQNISKGGFKLKSDNPLKYKDILRSGNEIIFETYEDFFKLKGKGEIIWTSFKENEAGVKFDELENRSRKFLEDFLEMF
jgi:hypothetical protein